MGWIELVRSIKFFKTAFKLRFLPFIFTGKRFKLPIAKPEQALSFIKL